MGIKDDVLYFSQSPLHRITFPSTVLTQFSPYRPQQAMTSRLQRASTIDSIPRTTLAQVKVKQEGGDWPEVKPEPNFFHTSAVYPGDLSRADKKKVSSVQAKVRSLLRARTPAFRRSMTPSRRRSVSRLVTASPAPSSTASTATNTTSGLRLDAAPFRLPLRRDASVVSFPRRPEEDEDDDDFSIISHNTSPVRRETSK